MPQSRLGPLDTHWMEMGQGSTSAVFVHCSLASSRALIPLMQAVGAGHMLAFDLPGHGGSAAPVAGQDIQDQALAQLSDLITARATAPVHLVGHSFGATVCARLAVEHPDRVASLTMFEPVFMSILHDLGWPAFAAELDLTRDFYADLAAERWYDAAAHFLTRWGLPGEWDKMPEPARLKVAAKMPIIALNNKAVIETGPDRMMAQDLGRMRCPVAVAYGGNSPAISTAVARAVTTVLPGAQSSEVAGAGHMLAITHVPDCAAIVRATMALAGG